MFMETVKQKFRPWKIIAYFTGSIIFLIVLAGFLFKTYLNSYKTFTDVELVANVECKKSPNSDQTFLEIQLFPDTPTPIKKIFPFKADEWVIEGRIIKWKNLINRLGMKNYYCFERVRGRFFDIEHEKKVLPLVYNLYDKLDKFWFFIFKHQKYMPFVDAAYGNSAFVIFQPDRKFEVYITNTGFMIKDVSVPKKRRWWFVG